MSEEGDDSGDEDGDSDEQESGSEVCAILSGTSPFSHIYVSTGINDFNSERLKSLKRKNQRSISHPYLSAHYLARRPAFLRRRIKTKTMPSQTTFHQTLNQKSH